MLKYEYSALLSPQTSVSGPLVLFSPPATEIANWRGVPQKKRLGESDTTGETAGFQRELNEKRLSELLVFYAQPRNVVQNPLLCATRKTPCGRVYFESTGTEGQTSLGKLCIE